MGKTIHKFAEELSTLVPRLHREIIRRQACILTKGEISFTQVAILHLLKERGACKMTEIAKAFSTSTSAVTGIVDRMVRSGFVKRVSAPRDRRVINIRLTSKGKRIINTFLKQRKKMMLEIFRNISAREREFYLNIVRKIYGILTKEKE